jgi:signal transduction histidine kinase
MNSALMMKHASRLLARRYQTALRHYLQQGLTATLKPAVRLGRRAVALSLETLDLALIHEQAVMAHASPLRSAAVRDRVIKRAGAFFAVAILPMEETHRSALESNVHLNRMNRALSRRTLDLAVSNRELKKEIAKRKVVEQTLRQSKQHSSLLLEQSRRMQEELRHLSRGILSAQEEERKRISRELHDVIAQVLTGINVRLAILKTEATSDVSGLTRNIARTQKLVAKSVDIVHRFAYDLRPAVLDYLGLIPALHSFMKSFIKETGIRVSLTAFAEVDKLDRSRRTVLYRVAQEALTNVARHARASRVEVIIKRLPKAILMQIKDNGKGFDPKQVLFVGRCKRLGLLGIRERVEMVGGKFTVESAPGKGTTVCAQIPFKNGARENHHR